MICSIIKHPHPRQSKCFLVVRLTHDDPKMSPSPLYDSLTLKHTVAKQGKHRKKNRLQDLKLQLFFLIPSLLLFKVVSSKVYSL